MKYLKVLLLSLSVFLSTQKARVNEDFKHLTFEQEEAFQVLTKKCNVCHSKQNPSKVFTLENMNGFARKIKRQVFVWKRMPKGKDIKLTKAEKETLKKWISSLKNKKK